MTDYSNSYSSDPGMTGPVDFKWIVHSSLGISASDYCKVSISCQRVWDNVGQFGAIHRFGLASSSDYILY